MNDYIELRVDASPCSETVTDILAAMLADSGYESFVPDANGLTAYIKAELFDKDAVSDTIDGFPIPGIRMRATDFLVKGRDWNREWEKNYFNPIVIGNRCVIHSSFHTDIPRADLDIIIDPKMAFGTGHHATTSLVAEQLLDTDLNGRTMIDMGTGTGILAIIAAMRGAAGVTAIEIDPAAHANAGENLVTNGVAGTVRLVLGDASALASTEPADMFVANINRNIITGDIARYAAALRPGGLMLLSGFYEADIPVVKESAAPYGLTETGHTVRDDWTCLRLRKAD